MNRCSLLIVLMVVIALIAAIGASAQTADDVIGRPGSPTVTIAPSFSPAQGGASAADQSAAILAAAEHEAKTVLMLGEDGLAYVRSGADLKRLSPLARTIVQQGVPAINQLVQAGEVTIGPDLSIHPTGQHLMGGGSNWFNPRHWWGFDFGLSHGVINYISLIIINPPMIDALLLGMGFFPEIVDPVVSFIIKYLPKLLWYDWRGGWNGAKGWAYWWTPFSINLSSQ